MSGAARGRIQKRRSLEDRIKELQARQDVIAKKKKLQDAIENAKRDLKALRLSRK